MLPGIKTGRQAICGIGGGRHVCGSDFWITAYLMRALIQVNDWFCRSVKRMQPCKGRSVPGLKAMEAVFEAKMIGPESLRQAYAVALLNAPSLEFAEFRRRMASAKNGALSGIFDRRGYIHAVFRSRVEERVDGGRSLAVFDFLVTDSLSHSLASQMVESLLKRAGEFGCDQMTFLSPSQQKNGFSFLELLEKLGFSGESVMMARKL